VKRLARLVALAGALALGWFLLGARLRDVTLVYDLSSAPDASAVEIDVRAGPTLVRHARLAVRPGEQLRHPVKLKEGLYRLDWRIERASGAESGSRPLEIDGDQTIVLPLGR
jgi:hypothetical protein